MTNAFGCFSGFEMAKNPCTALPVQFLDTPEVQYKAPFGVSNYSWVRSFPFAYHLRMRNLLSTVSPFQASAMHRGFLRLRGFCAPSPIAQAAAFRPAAVSPSATARRAFLARPPCSAVASSAPTFSRCGVSCVLFNPRSTRRSSGPALKAAQPA